MEEDMQRTLCAEFPPALLQWDRTATEWTNTGSDYISLGGGAFYAQQDIDLSGYAMKKKTFYPYSSFEQRGSYTSGGFATPVTRQPYVIDITIISSVPLTTEDIPFALNGLGFTQFGAVGGYTNVGRFDRSVIIHGQTKWYTTDSNMTLAGGDGNILKLVTNEVYSSLEPTAADKLYGYRIIAVSAVNDEGNSAILPPTRVLIPGNIASEPTLEYMMRLKRSYELANQV